MILDGCHFTYGWFDSREHEMVFAHCDTSGYDQLMGTVSSSYVFNKRNKARYISGDIYEDSPITFDAEVIFCNPEVVGKEQSREVEKALFSRPGFQKLYVDMTDDTNGESFEIIDGVTKRTYLNCRFVNPSKIVDGADHIVGYKFTVECDSCVGWQDPMVQKFTFDGNVQKNITVRVDTDLTGYIYPKVKIHIGSSGGDISITNSLDGATRITKFVGLTPNIDLVLDGNHNYVSGQNYDKFSNQNFIRLLDGDNPISINGDVASVEFEWSNRRYL